MSLPSALYTVCRKPWAFEKDFKRDFRKNSVDLVAGGPPCQGFSGIGIRRSYSVDKVQLPSNHLFEDMAFWLCPRVSHRRAVSKHILKP